MVTTSERMHDALRAHLTRFWPRRSLEDFRWTLGPIARTLPDFRVIRVAATRSEPWIYVSSGAWKVRSGHDTRFELVIQSPTATALHVESLAMVANFYADPRYNLHLGSVLEIGRPWMEASTCNHFLVSLPYPFGPTFEYFTHDQVAVRLFWLCPITADEAAFARAHGAEPLEQKFESAAIDTLDVYRRSVLA